MRLAALVPSLVVALSFTMASDAEAARKKKVAPPPPPPVLEPATATLVDAALVSDVRSAEEKVRDANRHPKDALAFFGLKATMTVVEVSPGGGWWTDILAPVLRDNGKLILAQNADVNSAGRSGLGAALTRLAAKPDVFGKAMIVHYAPAKSMLAVEPGSADMVMVFRHMHGLIGNNVAPQAMKLYFDALKPGGILAVEQHRWPDDKPYPAKQESWGSATNGYIKTTDVIALATAAGFRLEASSEINANPKDTKDYAKGVWALPPALGNGETDKAKYLAIGESDRMTLKFVKP
jgi:predicted methyltransferase